MTQFKPLFDACSGSLIAALTMWSFAGGGVSIMPVSAQDGSSEAAPRLPDTYWDAIDDAKRADPDEIFHGLTAITPHNDALTRDDQGRVLVTTWTSWDGYTQNIGNKLILTRDLWVTIVPDLQTFCRSYRRTSPTATTSIAARLNQLLGLPPEAPDLAADRQIVEIWVDPHTLFRPSPDPEITDPVAEIGFRPASEFSPVSPSYQQWFYAQYDQRYQHYGQPITDAQRETAEVVPYPWTQLGYTYDWGDASDWDAIDPDRPDEVGLSEFVVRQWSPILIQAAHNVDDYCN
jgi:hypothetical protein